jgi:NADH-quinone oxidoreductase subunit N
MVLALGGLMTMVGLAFKLSAVPFHFWCPDVFEGATAEVNAFLSVASKAAALALLVRVTVGLGVLPSVASDPDPPTTDVQTTAGIFQYASDETEEVDTTSDHGAVAALAPVRQFMVRLIAILAVITCTFGNLAAYGQTNIKRMLAYSTIAHAGYMMMAVAAAIALAGRAAAAQDALAALLLYVGFYLFMNLGAFAIVAFLRNAMQSEEIADYAGLIRTAPVVTVAMVVILFSLIGLPPLAGFIGKFFIFYSLVEAGGTLMMFLLVVGGINTVLSLVYYLRVAKVMCIDTESDTRGPVSLGLVPVFYAAIVAAPLVVFGIWPDEIREIALAASKQLFT